jgi:TRAP-type C4-dicarboxylate transport system permease small subunit
MDIAANILLCFCILLVILFWLIWPGFYIWGTVYAISSLSKKGQTSSATPIDGLKQARSGSPIDGFKRDYKRIKTVLKISALVLATLLALLIYGSIDLSHWLARQWRKRPPSLRSRHS